MEITMELAAQIYGVLRRTAERYSAEGLDECARYAHELANTLFNDGESFNESVYEDISDLRVAAQRGRRVGRSVG